MFEKITDKIRENKKEIFWYGVGAVAIVGGALLIKHYIETDVEESEGVVKKSLSLLDVMTQNWLERGGEAQLDKVKKLAEELDLEPGEAYIIERTYDCDFDEPSIVLVNHLQDGWYVNVPTDMDEFKAKLVDALGDKFDSTAF